MLFQIHVHSAIHGSLPVASHLFHMTSFCLFGSPLPDHFESSLVCKHCPCLNFRVCSINCYEQSRCSLNTYERKALREFFTKVLKVSSLFWKLQKKTAFPKSFSPGWGNPPYDPLHLTSTVQLGLKIQELRWKHHQEATQMEERKFCQGPRI